MGNRDDDVNFFIGLFEAASRVAFFLVVASAIGTLCGLGAVYTFFKLLVSSIFP